MGLDVKKQDLKDAFKECKPADEASPVQASAEISDEQLEGSQEEALPSSSTRTSSTAASISPQGRGWTSPT